MNKLNKSRIFFGINVSHTLKNAISMLSSTIEGEYKDIKWVTGTNLHLTLFFIGNLHEDKIETMKNEIKNIFLSESFEMTIEGTGVFPNPSNPKVFWLGINKGKEKLELIHGKLEEKIVHFKENQYKEKFVPHITIGRINTEGRRSKRNIGNFLNALYEPIKIDVNSVQLYESKLYPEGPIYTMLDEFILT